MPNTKGDGVCRTSPQEKKTLWRSQKKRENKWFFRESTSPFVLLLTPSGVSIVVQDCSRGLHTQDTKYAPSAPNMYVTSARYIASLRGRSPARNPLLRPENGFVHEALPKNTALLPGPGAFDPCSVFGLRVHSCKGESWGKKNRRDVFLFFSAPFFPFPLSPFDRPPPVDRRWLGPAK